MNDDNQHGVARWTSVQVYVLSAVCLIIGVAVGYLFRGSETSRAPVRPPAVSEAQKPADNPMSTAQVTPEQLKQMSAQVTPEQLKQMADKKAAPLLEELKHKPKDPETLAKVGGYYFVARQFGEATQFYEKAAKLRPTPDLLTKLSSAYYYSGSGEKAIATLDQALQMDPKFASALYNLGMLKWQVRGDTKGAIQSWEKLLKTNPNHPNRAQVERMIARVKEHQNIPAGTQTDKPAS